MTPLPKPLSQRPTGMPQRRRKSGLRTAAGALQEQFLDRMERLREDPTLVLARHLGDEPRTLGKLRRQLEALKAGRKPLAARFDTHVLGATYRAMQLADWESVPRMLDAKIAGQRRFYVQRGQVVRACTLGVQNFDQPRVLMLAYASMAQRHGLHFVAMADHVLCLGKRPAPPPEWFGLVGGDAVPMRPEGDDWGCGHTDRDHLVLRLEDGPGLAVCGPCGAKLEGLHRRMRERYVGPQMKKPFALHVRKPDGTLHEPSREAQARYRAGLATETDVIRSAP